MSDRPSAAEESVYKPENIDINDRDGLEQDEFYVDVCFWKGFGTNIVSLNHSN